MKNKKRIGSLLCMLAASALLLTGCAMGEADGAKTVQGIKALEEGEYEQAQKFFEDAVREGEQQMLACRGLGMAYMGLAKYEEAEESFKAALEYADNRQPENVRDIRLYLATVQYRLGEYEDAVGTCTDLLEADQEGNVEAYYLRGAASLMENEQDAARADFDAAVAMDPGNYDLYLNIYECYNQKNLSGLGGEYLQSALNIQGEELEHYYNRGRVYFYLENYEEAQRQLIGPVEAGYEPAMYLIGRVYLALDDYEHARAVYQQIADKSGASAETYNGLALCAMQMKDYDTALSYISQGLALEDAADKQELYFNEILVYEKKLDFETAKIKAQEYVVRYPSDEAGQREKTFLSTR